MILKESIFHITMMRGDNKERMRKYKEREGDKKYKV